MNIPRFIYKALGTSDSTIDLIMANRGKPLPPAEPPDADHALARPHLYGFACKVLPKCFLYLPSNEASPVIRYVRAVCEDGWNYAGRQLPKAQRLYCRTFKTSVQTSPDGHTVVIINLPKPQNAGESYMAAALYDPPTDPPATEYTARYFTLEYAPQQLDSPSHTVICEWLRGGAHRYLGAGPAPEVELFYKAVLKLVDDTYAFVENPHEPV